MKICCECKDNKQDSEFWKRSDRKSGLSSRCKECSSKKRRKYYSENSEEIKRNQNLYYQQNKEKFKGYNLRYTKNLSQEGIERRRETHRKWYQRTKDQRQEVRNEKFKDPQTKKQHKE